MRRFRGRNAKPGRLPARSKSTDRGDPQSGVSAMRHALDSLAASGTRSGAAARALVRVGRAFDRVFAGANPWHHLGALGFYFFWIATVTGIYLYIFFDTSVDGAWRSVDALTRSQWVAGGVMRSLHRYASDAMVVAVALHLVKELASGRFSGFRWFSWFSGVPLLWLLFASGVVGYWLVWDELAQFVAIAVAEWFDALPLFSDPLVRNFVEPGAVNDRLFTLLVFLHIGVPLALLAGMFVHIQRVNYADVTPPRGLALGTLGALIVLSLAAPALSHSPADLARAPQALALDWFYLAPFPLIYAFSPQTLWWLAAGVTLALALLPFVARPPVAPVARVDLANCNGCARCFADCPYGAVVMRPRAGGRQGRQHAVVIPALCASCGICTGACPSSTPFRSSERLVTGIDMPQQPIDGVRARLERVLGQLAGERRVVLFGCDHGADLSCVERPDVAAISLLCIGMLPPSFIEFALRHGADGVLIATCRRGECVYRLGDTWLEERLAGGREPRLRPSVARERVRLTEAGPGEEAALAGALAGFRAALAAIRPNPPRRSSRKRSGLASTQQGAG